MLNFDPLRKWTDRVVKDIENEEFRDPARILFTIIHYIFLLCLVWAACSAYGNTMDAIVQVAKAAAGVK